VQTLATIFISTARGIVI